MATWEIMLLVQALSTLVSLGFIFAFMMKKDDVKSPASSKAHHEVPEMSGMALA